MKKTLILTFTILLALISVFADVAPPSGMTYVPFSLRVEVAEDFPEYRFFLQSPMDVEEVVIVKDAPATIDGEGRNGAKRLGKLLAIPKKNLSGFSEKITTDQLLSLHESLNRKEIDGVIELQSHEFRAEVWTGSEGGKRVKHVLIEKDPAKGLKTSTASSGGKVDFSIYGIAKSYTIPGIVVISFIVLASITAIVAGIRLLRRKSQSIVK